MDLCKLVSLNTNYGAKIQVADIKKKCIENIIHCASQCRQINEIILFGSALEERCNEQSDIDIAIISKHTVTSLCNFKGFSKFVQDIYNFDFKQEYDRLYFISTDEIEQKKNEVPICKELSQKGKIIYRRM